MELLDDWIQVKPTQMEILINPCRPGRDIFIANVIIRAKELFILLTSVAV